MAILDYATLQTAVSRWLARSDLAADIPDFISLAESRINRDVRVRQMQSVQYGISQNGRIPLPADFIGAISLKATDNDVLQYLALDLDGDFILDGSELLDGENPAEPYMGMYEIHPESRMASPPFPWSAGAPTGYSVVNGEIRLVNGNAAVVYALTYWARIPSLSNASQQNWLLLEEPGIYLYGALIEASPFLQDDQRAVLWSTQYKAIVDGMKRSDDDQRYGNAPSIKSPIRGP